VNRFVSWNKRHSFDGTFWLPSRPSRSSYGRLKFKPGNWPVLISAQQFLPNHDVEPTIAGSIGGMEVTLLDCKQVSHPGPPNEGATILFAAALMGRLVHPSAVGRRFLLRFTNLSRLTARDCWENIGQPGDERLTFRFETERHLLTITTSAYTLEMFVSAPLNMSHSMRGNSLAVRPKVDVVLDFPRPVGFRDVQAVWKDLALLWSLMTGTKSEVTAARVSPDARSPTIPPEERGHDLDFDGTLIGLASATAGEAGGFGDFFYDLAIGDHAGKLATVISTWAASVERLRPSARLLVDAWDNNISWEAKLGLFAQALEAFHRDSPYPQTFTSEDDFSRVELALTATIGTTVVDPDLRTSLRKRVQYGNQVSLRRRTRDLVRDMPPPLRDAFGKWKPRVDRMTDLRNAIIHRDRSTAPSFLDVVEVTGHFGMTIHAALLRAIGIPDDVIADRLQAQPFYQDWLRRPWRERAQRT
jgi:hypothetical protein